MKRLFLLEIFGLVVGLVPPVSTGAEGPAPPVVPAPYIAGMALTPHYENPAEGITFDALVDDVAALGANHLSVVVAWSQTDIRAHHIGPHAKETQDEAVLRRIIRRARGRGLAVTLFPILWIEHRAPGEWRGTLAPSDAAAWWASYRAFVLHHAALAESEQVALFSVGSELGSMEADAPRWRALIAEVRGVFSGRLTYSANWDHYRDVPFWDALDLVGITGYHRIAPDDLTDPSEAQLVAAWQAVRRQVLRWRLGVGRPLLFTELGYPSRVGAAQRPWDHGGSGAVDLDLQRRCLAAFDRVWRLEPALAGVFFWNAWGKGGALDDGYVTRGKPGEAVVRSFFAATHRRQVRPLSADEAAAAALELAPRGDEGDKAAPNWTGREVWDKVRAGMTGSWPGRQ